MNQQSIQRIDPIFDIFAIPLSERLLLIDLRDQDAEVEFLWICWYYNYYY